MYDKLSFLILNFLNHSSVVRIAWFLICYSHKQGLFQGVPGYHVYEVLVPISQFPPFFLCPPMATLSGIKYHMYNGWYCSGAYTPTNVALVLVMLIMTLCMKKNEIQGNSWRVLSCVCHLFLINICINSTAAIRLLSMGVTAFSLSGLQENQHVQYAVVLPVEGLE